MGKNLQIGEKVVKRHAPHEGARGTIEAVEGYGHKKRFRVHWEAGPPDTVMYSAHALGRPNEPLKPQPSKRPLPSPASVPSEEDHAEDGACEEISESEEEYYEETEDESPSLPGPASNATASATG